MYEGLLQAYIMGKQVIRAGEKAEEAEEAIGRLTANLVGRGASPPPMTLSEAANLRHKVNGVLDTVLSQELIDFDDLVNFGPRSFGDRSPDHGVNMSPRFSHGSVSPRRDFV
jgi:hypothetical protein